MAFIQGYKDAIADALDGREFDAVYNEVKEDLDDLQKTNYHSEAAVFLYKKQIQKLTKRFV